MKNIENDIIKLGLKRCIDEIFFSEVGEINMAQYFRKQNLKVYVSLLTRNHDILHKTSLILYNTISIFNNHEKKSIVGIVGTGENKCLQPALPRMISTIPKRFSNFNLSSWAGLQFCPVVKSFKC